MSQPTPYWRLSGFYFFYFATLGVYLPFWSLYLKDLGFTAEAIGTLAAILIGTKIVAPNLWGWLADHTGRRMMVIRAGSFLACVTFAGVLFTQSYTGLALVMLLFGLFSNAALPQVEATTLNHLRDRLHGYSLVRVWGSIGFIVAVVVGGWWLADRPLLWVPWIILSLLIVNWLVTLQLPRHDVVTEANGSERFRQVLRKPEVLALIGVCLLMQASHGPYYTFYSLYLQEAGYGLKRIGELWALGVLAEVGLFLIMHKLLFRYGLRMLLLVSLVLAAVRWLMIGEWVDSMTMLVVAQLLHAATFGIYHAVTIQLIHRYFTGHLQGRGQALYSSLSFGAGLALGTLISGYLWEAIDPVWSFRFAVVASLIALAVAWHWIKE